MICVVTLFILVGERIGIFVGIQRIEVRRADDGSVCSHPQSGKSERGLRIS